MSSFDINQGGGMGWLSILLTVLEKDPTLVSDIIGLFVKVQAKNPEIVSQVASVVKAKTPPIA